MTLISPDRLREIKINRGLMIGVDPATVLMTDALIAVYEEAVRLQAQVDKMRGFLTILATEKTYSGRRARRVLAEIGKGK